MRRRPLTLAVIAGVIVLWAITFQAPSPSTQSAMAEALLRHELASPNSYLGQNFNYQPPLYVYLIQNDEPVDPSADSLRRLSSVRIGFLPGSGWIEGHGMRIIILAPKPLGFGFYRVWHLYYCSMTCGSHNFAVMFYDHRNWHVVGSFMTQIS